MRNWDFPGSEPIDIAGSVGSGRVAVSGEETDTTRVRIESDDDTEVRVDFQAGRLEIRQQSGGFLRGHGNVDVTVSAPAGSRAAIRTGSGAVSGLGDLGALEVKAGSGDVTVGSIRETLVVDTGSGDIGLESAGGAARLHTASGDIRVRRGAGEVTATSASGDISIGEAGESVRAQTASGDIRVDRVATGEANVKTVSGDVAIGVADGIGAYLDLSSLTGRVRSELDETDGDGEVPLHVICRSVSGDIRIVRATTAAA